MNTAILDQLRTMPGKVAATDTRPLFGILVAIEGPVVHIRLEHARLGQICKIVGGAGQGAVFARIISVSETSAVASPYTSSDGLKVGALVRIDQDCFRITEGDGLLGRVIDGMGQLIDNEGDLEGTLYSRRVEADAPSPLDRPVIHRPLVTSVRAIDAFLTLGQGQRIGIFGPPGTGKSTLLSAIIANAECDVLVVGLIGERGREVAEFLEKHLTPKARKRTVMVVATSDKTAMERLNAVHVATAVAEGFRDRGQSVLLLVDSLTRVARALREIGLAAGEMPTRRGYPASVYTALPGLIERAGLTETGCITAIYTVLVEGETETDPIAEETRSLTDGHIILSQKLAENGHYPAIDVLKSLSRIMTQVTDARHQKYATEARSLMAQHRDMEMLIRIGEYQPGTDAELDRAVTLAPQIQSFLTEEEVLSGLKGTLRGLRKVLQNG